MREFIRIISEAISQQMDFNRFLVVENASKKKSIFLYRINSALPTYIVKMPSNDDGEEKCKNEYEALEYLQQIGIPNVDHALPAGKAVYKGINCYIQTALYGNPMLGYLRLYRKTPIVCQFNLITDRLIDIYKITGHFGKREGRSFSCCFKHGDFWIGNLASAGRNLILQDLEYATSKGQPLHDLLHFGLSYHSIVRNIGKVGCGILNLRYSSKIDQRIFELTIRDVEAVVLGPGPFYKIMRHCVKRYIQSCEINRDDASELMRDYFNLDRRALDVPDDWLRHVLI